MEDEVIILHKNLEGTSFYGLSKNGFSWYNVFYKTLQNKNLQRLTNYIFASIKIGGDKNNLVFNLRPILYFSDQDTEKIWSYSFFLIKEHIQITEEIFSNIWNFIDDLQKNILKAHIFQLLVYVWVFKKHNIQIEVDNCFFCQTKFDLYCLSLDHASIICHVCYNKFKYKLKNCFSNIYLLKFNEFFIKEVKRNYHLLLNYNFNNLDLIENVLKFYKGIYSMVIG